MITVEIIFY